MGSLMFGKEAVNRQVPAPGCGRRGPLRASYLGWHILSLNCQMRHCTSLAKCAVLCAGALRVSDREQELFKSQLLSLLPGPGLKCQRGVWVCWNWSPGVERRSPENVGSCLKTRVLVCCV